MTQHSDYDYVERAIRFIESNSRRQPALSEIASAVGLSEFHFQRLFSRWAGISPKRFVQFLTLQHAKALLRESRSLLDTTYEAGLSSPGRLHDLFVTIDSVTPGEFKTGGLGLRIDTGVHETPFGTCLLAATARGICALTFIGENGDEESARASLRAEWPGADIVENRRATGALVQRVFERASDGSSGPISVLVKGTNFQVNVWRALLQIPMGAVLSYEDLAERIGQPAASRAVGNAVGRNPVPFLIPCHRVIRKTGDFGYYGGGPTRKRAMLAWEFAAAHNEAPASDAASAAARAG